MAKIFNPPSEIKVPEIGHDFKKYEKECEEFATKLKEFLIKRNPNGELVGEIIRFPVADSYAEYMVASLKPVALVHMPLMDAWDFEYANRLTAKDIKDKVAQQKALEKLFSRKKAGEE